MGTKSLWNSTMKLAEALRIRSDCSKKLQLLKKRILTNAKVQEGDTPTEDPSILLKEFASLDFDLTKLIAQINLVNAVVVLDLPSFLEDDAFNPASLRPGFKFEEWEAEEGHDKPLKKSMCEALMERDSIKRRIDAIEFSLAAGDVASNFNYSKSEIKIISIIDTAGLQKRRDNLAYHLRVLDTIIQEANWNVDFEDTVKDILVRERKRQTPKRWYFF